MKKITALVLALVMALSLLPMSVWAEGEEATLQLAEGATSYNAEYGIKVFTQLTDSKLSFNGTMNKNWENGKTVETLSCASAQSATMYVAIGEWNTATFTDITTAATGTTVETIVGKLTDTDSRTYNVYELSASKPLSGNKVTYTVDLAWSQYGEYGETPMTGSIDFAFDFTPVFTGNCACGQAGVFFFESYDFENKELDGGNAITGSYEGVTVACTGQKSKTIFLAANKYDSLTVTNATLSNVDGVWFDQNMACNIYALTVDKPQSGSVVECTVTRSWENNGTQSASFTLAFDFSPVFTGNCACGQAGVFFFESCDFENEKLVGGNAIMGSYEGITVACAGHENRTIFLTANQHDDLSVSNATLSSVDGVWYDETPDGRWPCNIFALTVNKPETGSVVEFTVTRTSTWYDNGQEQSRSETFPLVFDFDRKPGSGENQGGGEDTTYWKTYNTKYAGNSTFTVRRTELQAQVLTLPDEINDNNELIITVHNAAENNEAVWRELVQRDELMVSYFFDSIEDKDTAKPKVKSLGTNGSIAEALAWLVEYPFVDYNFPSGRFNGVDFAWASTESDRTVVIPTEGLMVSSWIWGYDNGDGTYTEKPDGVIVKLVLDEDVSNAIVLENEKYPAVEAERVSLVGHDGLDIGDEKIFSGSYEEASGVFSYQYIGNATAEQGFVSAAINTDVLEKIEPYRPEQTDEPIYRLLKVTAPAGYTAKYFSSRFFEGGVEGSEITLEYFWRGLGTEQTYVLTWCKGEGESYREYVEQITVFVPTVAGVETWMDHINGSKSQYTNCATAVADANVLIKQAGVTVSGAEINYSNGVLWTDFADDEMLDVEAIESATISIKIPDGAVAYKLARPGDGADDPTYNENNKWAPDDFQSILEASVYVALQGNEEYIENLPIYALKEQNIGDIQYYYSADRGTWLILVKWIFDGENENNGAKYEWIRLDAENYFCQWEEVVKAEGDVTDEVEKPTAILDALADGKIKLVTRVHPQKQEDGYGQYFFELEMVAEGEGNVYTDPDNESTYFTIILPYSFMGEEWNYEMAKKLKEKPIINHYDKNYKQLAGNMGAITGEYTERGIEFKVNSFSPFLLTWDETVKDKVPGGYPGGYYPIVTPDTPEEKPEETKPAETKPVEKPATPPVKDDVTPVPEDTTPDVTPSEPPVIDDGAVDETPSDDAVQDNSGAGLWIGVGLVALAAVVAVVIIMATRKKRRES